MYSQTKGDNSHQVSSESLENVTDLRYFTEHIDTHSQMGPLNQ